ncbi:aldo/keto reductase [Dactylosporangium sucinum]|uniref:Oxidoreductase n=1 Tax=Dactylosporangium sucinum TaxID=1424081 RepID=A0A917X7X5_9ACTN|nr:aldo/keto reductase [Dactylosporangium sucinum]GGM87206.1 oxidoreductase [Dactylosporangium sucinum]
MTGPSLPPVCLGTYTLAAAWGSDLDSSRAALRRGVSEGLVFLDTAHAYGRAESILGELFSRELVADRDSLVLCSKGGLELRRREGSATPFAPNSRPAFLRASLTKSLSRLGVEHLDYYLVHWYDPDVALAEVAGAMQSFVDEGLTRYVGVSNYTVEQMTTFRQTAQLDAIQVPYSLFSRGVEDEVLPFARRNAIMVMGYAALAQGFLSGTFGPEPAFAENDFRRGAPDFSGERYATRVQAAGKLAVIAQRHGVGLADLAVAWAASGAAPVVPLVGVQAPAHIDAIRTAMRLKLTADDLIEMRAIAQSAPEMDFAGLVS